MWVEDAQTARHAGGHRFKSCSAHYLRTAGRSCQRFFSFVASGTYGGAGAILSQFCLRVHLDTSWPRLYTIVGRLCNRQYNRGRLGAVGPGSHGGLGSHCAPVKGKGWQHVEPPRTSSNFGSV